MVVVNQLKKSVVHSNSQRLTVVRRDALDRHRHHCPQRLHLVLGSRRSFPAAWSSSKTEVTSAVFSLGWAALRLSIEG
jgi:hypothetical protein